MSKKPITHKEAITIALAFLEDIANDILPSELSDEWRMKARLAYETLKKS